MLDALLAVKPIVMTTFFESWTKELEQNPESPLPDIKKFIPPPDMHTLGQFEQQLFLPNPDRKAIFRGKLFIFPAIDNSFPFGAAVEKAGGKVVYDLKAEDGANYQTILVENSSRTQPEDYALRLKSLKLRGERAIPMKEITFAIVAISTQRYTNSSLNLASSIFKGMVRPEAANAQESPYAPESHSLDVSMMAESQEPPCKITKIDVTQEFKEPSQPLPSSSIAPVEVISLLTIVCVFQVYSTVFL